MSQTRELKLKLTVVADASGASKVVSSLGEQAVKAAEMAGGKAAAALAQGMARGAPGGGGGFGGLPAPGGGGGGGFPASMMHAGAMSRVSAFDRPIPVIVVGPKSLIDGGMGAKVAAAKEKEKEDDKKNPMTALNILRNLGLGGIAGRMGQIQGYGEVASEAGFGRLGGFLGRNALGMSLVGASAAGSVGLMRASSRLAGDTFLTSEQRDRALFRDVAPFGRSVQGMYDDFTKRTGRMQDVQVTTEKLRAINQAYTQGVGFRAAFNPELVHDAERARQLAGARPLLEPTVNRTTATGERAFRELQRLLPLEREEAKLKREAAAATAARVESEKGLAGLEKQKGKLDELKKEEENLRRRVKAGGSGPEYLETVSDLERKQAQILELEGIRKQTIENVRGLRTREAEAARAAEGAGIQITRERAAIFEDRAATSAGSARRLGGMNPIERQFARQAFELLQRHGPDMLPPEILAQAQQFAPEAAGKILETHGAGTAEFREGMGLSPADFAGNPEELRRKAMDARNQAAKKEMESEARTAGAVAAAGRDMGEQVVKAIEQMRDIIVQLIETRLRVSKSGPGS